MIQYPLHFPASVISKGGVATSMRATAHGYPPIPMAIPQEFLGPGEAYCPEDLYTLSILSCFIATFKVFAEKGNLQFEEIKADGTLTVDRNAKGAPELQKIALKFYLSGVEDEEKARRLLAETEKSCLVANAIKTEKTFSYQFC